MVRAARRLISGVLDPPESLRIGPFRKGAFTSALHDERTAAWLGISLGISFGVCFLTGLISHLIQQPPSWFVWPARPASLYRVTQGVHVATGIVAIPLLLAKLWVVYPRLWTWPPIRGIAHALERISLLPLVAGSLFLLHTGLANIALWYPWRFFFPAAHYWASWITIGALIVHIGAKSTLAAAALRGEIVTTGTTEGDEAPPLEPSSGGLSRRGFLIAVAAAAGTLTLATLGQTVRPLRTIGLLAPRRPGVGPQGLPVNKTAASAGVEVVARDPSWMLSIEGNVPKPLTLSLDDLRQLPQRQASLPISCVEGWSADATWRGVAMRDLLSMAGAKSAEIDVVSMQPPGRYSHSLLNSKQSLDPDTLLATELNGEPLHLDHGYPLRLIGPNRPGVMQTKWVHRLVVL